MKENPSYDVVKMREDMALRGWVGRDLARVAGVSDATVHRFLLRQVQSARVAMKLSTALGYSVRRYLVSSRERVA